MRIGAVECHLSTYVAILELEDEGTRHDILVGVVVLDRGKGGGRRREKRHEQA